MTIQNVLDFVNSYKQSKYSDEQKIKWLNTIETEIYKNIILTHEYNEGEEEITFDGYDSDTDTSTELIVPAPYDELYIFFVMAQIDYLNREMRYYDNNIKNYEGMRKEFYNRYNQDHMPKKHSKIIYY